MASENQSAPMKTVWIDENNRIISFSTMEHAQMYCAEESVFWKRILVLMQEKYKVQ